MTASDRAIGHRWLPLAPALAIATGVIVCMVYANIALAVTKQEDYRYFPPFAPGINVNMNRDLGGEHFHIACSLAKGNGFANPFGDPTGPTAWMPPILPAIIATLWWACAGNREAVIFIVLTLQAGVLIGTGLLVIAVDRFSRSAAATKVPRSTTSRNTCMLSSVSIVYLSAR